MVGGGIARQEGKAANQVTAVAPGASSYLETVDSGGQASGSPTRVEEGHGFLSTRFHWSLVEDRGHGGQGEGDRSLAWALKASRSLRRRKRRYWLADLGLVGPEVARMRGRMVSAAAPMGRRGDWYSEALSGCERVRVRPWSISGWADRGGKGGQLVTRRELPQQALLGASISSGP